MKKIIFENLLTFDEVVKDLCAQYPNATPYASVVNPNGNQGKLWSGDSLAKGVDVELDEWEDHETGEKGTDLFIWLKPEKLIPFKANEPEFNANRKQVLTAMGL